MKTPVILYSRMWFSGTGLYAQGLAEGMAAAGVPLVFIAPAGDPEPALPGVRRVRPPRDRLDGSRVRRATRSLARIGGGLAAVLRARVRARVYVVTIAEPLVFWLPVAALLRLSGARLVLVCHDPLPHAWRLPAGLRWLERGAHRANYALASRIVVLARSAGTVLADTVGVPAAKIARVPHGAFAVPDAGPLPGTRTLLAYGTIRRNKQVHVAIAAIAAARAAGCDVRLVVAGGADANDPAYLDECRAAAAAAGDAVRLEIGYVTDDRQAALLAGCDALLLPYADGFASQSGVAVTAGIAGRPVICAAAGGIPDLIEDGLAATVIAPPAGVAEVARAIVAFFDTPVADWSRRAAAGRTSLSAALAWSAVGARFAALVG